MSDNPIEISFDEWRRAAGESFAAKEFALLEASVVIQKLKAKIAELETIAADLKKFGP